MSSAAEPRPVRVPGPVLPVMLDIRGRRCVVVGTTDIATQRVAALATAGAVVDAVPTLADADRPGARLVFAATGSALLDAEVAAAAEALGILVNAHDQPDVCAFHMAARLTRGPLEMAFGSGGAVPAVAVRVRNLVAELVPEDVVPLIEDAARVRREAKAAGRSAMSLDWDELLTPLLAAIDARRRGAGGSTP
jgi:siroheme synthase (precorrin-2 oxidase/ferrochelatase)